MTNPYLDASEHIADAITTMPGAFDKGNAAVLYQIINELERSHTAQLKLLGGLRRLNLKAWRDGLLDEVDALVADLEENSDAETLNRQRTHCHNLQLLGRQLVGEGYNVAQVQQALGPLYSWDDDFIDDLEGLAAQVVSAAKQVQDELRGHEGDDSALERARNARDLFIQQHRERLATAKALLVKMGNASRELALQL
jgi:hypothetical protein